MSKFLTKTIDAEGGRVTFTLGNGKAVTIVAGELSTATRERAMLHGLSQKVGDAAASFSAREDYTGALEAMQAVVDNLENGKWNAGREGSTRSDLVQAIANLKKLNVERVQEAFTLATEEQVKAWMKNPAIAAEILRIRSERASRGVSADAVEEIDIEV